MLDTLTLDSFRPLVGSGFELCEPDPAAQLILIEAESLLGIREKGPAGFREPFSLLFRGPADLELPQQICRLRHADLGELALFLVPLQPDREGSYYEAVFT